MPLFMLQDMFAFQYPKVRNTYLSLRRLVSCRLYNTMNTDEEIETMDSPHPKTVTTKVPEVEIHLYQQGKGPIDVFKSSLGGWEQNQLETRDILDKYRLKLVFAFTPGAGRGAPIRFSPKNGRSVIVYKDGSVIHIDGEPRDSLIKPVTKILLGVLFITVLIALVLKQQPAWIENIKLVGGYFNLSPWILACVVIVITRMRKRTWDFLKKFGW